MSVKTMGGNGSKESYTEHELVSHTCLHLTRYVNTKQQIGCCVSTFSSLMVSCHVSFLLLASLLNRKKLSHKCVKNRRHTTLFFLDRAKGLKFTTKFIPTSPARTSANTILFEVCSCAQILS